MKSVQGAFCAGLALVILFQVAAVAEEAVAADDPAAALADLKQREAKSTLGRKEKAEAFKPEFETFAEEHAGTEHGLEASMWLLRNTWWEREAGTMYDSAAAIGDGIVEAYFDSPELAKLPELHYVFSSEKRAELFGKLAADSPHSATRAAALYSLARSELRSKDEATRALGRGRLETVVADFADEPYRLTTYGAVAAAALSPHGTAALEVGKTAPEITGADYLGNPMKLSDYRGKVVVLDFWGDW